MLSGELARLAGVTVRALRHYHQVGVLPEPDRGVNDYRDYDVHHLVRVLRITRMASLGIPLERMPAFLEDPDEEADVDPVDPAEDLLAQLDAELVEQMERMHQQRELIAHLRAHRAPPDLPPELAPVHRALTGWKPSPRIARIDRDQSVLMAHFLGAEGTARLADFYRRFADSAPSAAHAGLSERFERLGPGSSQTDVEEVAASLVAALAPMVAEAAGTAPVLDLDGAVDLLAELSADGLTEQQLETLALLEAGLADQ